MTVTTETTLPVGDTVAEQAADLPVQDELVEDVSIDGMCGVY